MPNNCFQCACTYCAGQAVVLLMSTTAAACNDAVKLFLEWQAFRTEAATCITSGCAHLGDLPMLGKAPTPKGALLPQRIVSYKYLSVQLHS